MKITKQTIEDKLREEYKKAYSGILSDDVIEQSVQWLIEFVNPFISQALDQVIGEDELTQEDRDCVENNGGDYTWLIRSREIADDLRRYQKDIKKEMGY